MFRIEFLLHLASEAHLGGERMAILLHRWRLIGNMGSGFVRNGG